MQALADTPRLPDFFLVGHPKCGTTALYEILKRHPEVYMPAVKEPTFFADELPKGNEYRSAPKTLAEYYSLFESASPGECAGEATPLYLWSETAAQRIADLQPSAKIIALLREPTAFLRSLHLQFVQVHWETEKDLRNALALEPVRAEGRQVPPFCPAWQLLLYSRYIRYVDQLTRYSSCFPSSNILILIYDDLRDDNEAVIRQIWRFLGVDDSVPVNVLEPNPTVGIRFKRLYGVLYAVAVGRGGVFGPLKKGIETVTPRGLRKRTVARARRGLTTTPPPQDEELMAELRVRYRPEVERLGEYLGRDLLSLWGY